MSEKKRPSLMSLFSMVLETVNFRFAIKNLSYLPRWIILVLDFFVVVCSGYFSNVLLENMGIVFEHASNPALIPLLYLVVTLFFFWVFRTYSGIIRHSSYIDSVKLFFAQFAVFSTLFLVNISHEFYFGHKLFLNTRLFLSVALGFCGLVLYRIVVKHVYEHYLKSTRSSNPNRIPVFIYGIDSAAIALAQALRYENTFQFKLLGFIDTKSNNETKQLLGLPILSLGKKIPVHLRYHKAQGLIIPDGGINKNEKFSIVNQCLDYNFKVFTVKVTSDSADTKTVVNSVKQFEIQDLLERDPIQLDTEEISKQLLGTTILVSGAAGSIGSEIVRQVLPFFPKQIILVDQAESPLHAISLEVEKKLLLLGNKTVVHCVIADIRQKENLETLFSTFRPEVVYHAAAYKHVPMMELHPAQAIVTNVLGTKNLADLALQYKVRNFVMVSTDKAVNPSNVMGASKRIAEKYVQYLMHKNTGKTKFITTRFGNVLGSNGSVVPFFSQQIAAGGPVTITHPEIIRYFMTIPEACQLVLEAGAMGNGGEIFIFDMGEPVRIIDLAKKMIRLAGLRPEIDIAIQVVGLRPGEKLYEELLNNSATTLPTHHKKIMIAKEDFFDYELINHEIQTLITLAFSADTTAIVAKMKTIVPEYVSKNSHYASLDEVEN